MIKINCKYTMVLIQIERSTFSRHSVLGQFVGGKASQVPVITRIGKNIDIPYLS